MLFTAKALMLTQVMHDFKCLHSMCKFRANMDGEQLFAREAYECITFRDKCYLPDVSTQCSMQGMDIYSKEDVGDYG